MNKHNLEEIEKRKAELIKVTTLVLDKKVRMAKGCLKIEKLLFDLGLHLDEDFLAIRIFNSDTDGYPIGKLIELWDENSGRKKDQKLKEIETVHQQDVFDACQKILSRYQKIN